MPGVSNPSYRQRLYMLHGRNLREHGIDIRESRLFVPTNVYPGDSHCYVSPATIRTMRRSRYDAYPSLHLGALIPGYGSHNISDMYYCDCCSRSLRRHYDGCIATCRICNGTIPESQLTSRRWCGECRPSDSGNFNQFTNTIARGPNFIGKPDAVHPRYVGVELEIPNAPRRREDELGLFRLLDSVQADCKYDGSIPSRGGEIVLPPARGSRLREMVKGMCSYMGGVESLHASCGGHIHVDATDADIGDLTRLARIWMSVEYAFLRTVPEKRLNSVFGGTYCQPVGTRTVAQYRDVWSNRYHTLNIRSAFDAHKTVEFRCFPSITVAEDILGYATIASHLVSAVFSMDDSRADSLLSRGYTSAEMLYVLLGTNEVVSPAQKALAHLTQKNRSNETVMRSYFNSTSWGSNPHDEDDEPEYWDDDYDGECTDPDCGCRS